VSIYESDIAREAHLAEYIVPKSGTCFIDIGAHIGYWTVYVAKKGFKVYSFEPNPDTYKLLLAATEKYKNVRPYQLAVGDKEIVAELYIHEYSGEDSLRIRTDRFTGRKVKVRVVKIDQFKFPIPIGVIKIDTEGYEAQILEGATETILQHHPRLLVEVHRGLRTLREEVTILFDILKGFGYNIQWINKKVTKQPILIADVEEVV